MPLCAEASRRMPLIAGLQNATLQKLLSTAKQVSNVSQADDDDDDDDWDA